MVNKPRYRELPVEPPSLDESWWEALMAEDEAQYSPQLARRPAPAGLGGKPAIRGAVPESQPVDWERARMLYEQDEVIHLEVTGFNRGGLLVSGDRLQGFVPVSHLVKMPVDQDEAEQEQWLMTYIKQKLLLKVIECDQERGRVVFSERAALAQPGSRIILLDKLEPGDCVRGTVTNITDFGVFVDLGGVEGLIHVSEISWGRVRHPSDVVTLGQKVDVYVIQVERERARVALSMKRLHPNPWETAEGRYYPGMITEAVVTSIVSFGAFARLEEGLDGLIHISEICNGSPGTDLNDMLQEGQHVRVRVLQVDGPKQRLGLSLRLNDAQSIDELLQEDV